MQITLQSLCTSRRLSFELLRSMSTSSNDSSLAKGAYNAEQYTRRPEHKPKTANEHEDKYVLTLHTDRKHHECMTALRNQYFPSHLNKLDAHIALFRALPGSHLPKIETDILTVAARENDFEIKASKPFMMGHGVGISADVSGAHRIYGDLKKEWKSWLSEQDMSFHPHYTIQNKVEKDVARRALQEIDSAASDPKFTHTGNVDGLTLWRYDKGYWRHRRDFMFGE